MVKESITMIMDMLFTMANGKMTKNMAMVYSIAPKNTTKGNGR